MTNKTITPVHPYYTIKAYDWIVRHGLKPSTNPAPLARWLEDHDQHAYYGSMMAAVTEDGEVVGEAYPTQSVRGTYYYLTLETAKRYGLNTGNLKPLAGMAMADIRKAVGKLVLWAKSSDMAGHVWDSERKRYEDAKTKYNF